MCEQARSCQYQCLYGTKFGDILSICYQNIERKRNYDGRNDDLPMLSREMCVHGCPSLVQIKDE